jgi:MoxR-like ATPase
VPDDVKDMVKPVWSHRLWLKTEAQLNETTPETVLDSILEKQSIPAEEVVRL